ncbi:uncharacterized protein N7483_009166 [Penicillium malachiteum]|uniref:uncharacterized protein n=1 Tax=Penicillium malachiteum TaxID=1324776 RepID=UPI002547749A|nr:uncharacterized protein N7483_009166 [Penicillium malachiteum]KAJ5721232.1 hypothetical protein N7483_009166 [Penicillium malachiteum]
MSLLKSAILLMGSAALVAGHGYVSSIEVDGTTYGGYLVDTYYFESDPPELIAWSTNATDDGYVAPTDYDSVNIICHKGSAPGALAAPVTLGGTVKLTWNTWPSDHHGPVITYLANCNGSCADVDKTALEFFKIDAGGMINDTVIPGSWASDDLIADDYSRTITIPTDIEAGNYVLRHEIIALHGAEDLNGAQNYPQCINLNVTGDGTATPSAEPATSFYKDTDPGIYIDIWQTISTYTIPGPTLYTTGSTATAAAAVSSTTTTAVEATQTSSSDTSSETPATSAQSSAVQPTATASSSSNSGTSSTGSSSGNSCSGESGNSDSSSSDETPSSTTTVAATTSTASSSSAITSGVLSGSCTEEDYWYCNDGTAFQRCVNGEWDSSQSMADGTECTAGISETLSISASSKKRAYTSDMHRRLARRRHE